MEEKKMLTPRINPLEVYSYPLGFTIPLRPTTHDSRLTTHDSRPTSKIYQTNPISKTNKSPQPFVPARLTTHDPRLAPRKTNPNEPISARLSTFDLQFSALQGYTFGSN